MRVTSGGGRVLPGATLGPLPPTPRPVGFPPGAPPEAPALDPIPGLGRVIQTQRGTGAPWAEGHRRLLDGPLEIDLFPSRAKAPLQRRDPGEGACSLCGPTAEGAPEAFWQGYRIVANTGPYVPADGFHLVVSSAEHRAQGVGLSDLGRMIELSQRMGEAQPVTLHYNGIAGNTQFHWHWQLTDQRLPLERALRSGQLPVTWIRRNEKVEIGRYAEGILRGLWVRGEGPAVQRWAAEIIRRLEADPSCRGHYNLVLMPAPAGRASLAIIPRRPPPVGSTGRGAFHGAFSYAGRLILPKAELDPAGLEAAKATALAELMDPTELKWLPELRRAPEPPILALRTERASHEHTQPSGHRLEMDAHGEWALPEHLSPGGVRLPTLRVPSAELRFLIFGDSGDGGEGQQQVAAALSESYRTRRCHFAIHTGDVIYPHGLQGPSDPAVEARVQRPYQALDRLYLSLGNHDWANSQGAGDPDAWAQVAAADDQLVMPSRYYRFGYRFGGRSADFLVLDTTVLASDDAQRAWLREQLQASQADYRIVIGHHPPYSYGLHGAQAHVQDLLLPELQGVDVYAGGHEHDLQVLENDDGILFLVSGAAAEGRATGTGPETQWAEGRLGFMALALGPEGLKLEVLGADGQPRYAHARPRQARAPRQPAPV